MQIITQHLGVPGDHKFMIDKKRKIKIENDDLGNVENFDMKKKKKKWYKKLIDVAVPVIGTVLTFVPGAQAVGMGINAAYSAYKGAEAIKHGDLLGGMLGIASSIVPGGNMVSKGLNIASGALRTVRAIEAKDWMGALSGGLGTVGMAGGGQKFQVAAGGVNTAQSIKEGDVLGAGAGFTGMVSDLSRPAQDPNLSASQQPQHTGASLAFQGMEQGFSLANAIDDKNYAGMGSAASGLINTGGEYRAYNRFNDEQAKLPLEQGVGGGPSVGRGPDVGPDGKPIILKAGYPNQTGVPAQSIEVAGGDTLSQIAERHGTTVEALMAANPEIADPNRIHAGQQLTLPEGVQPVVADQQQRLQAFADSQGGPSHMPSPPRPGMPGEQSISPTQGAAALADSEFGVAMEVFERDFNQAVDSELSMIDQQIADIDQRIADGVNHAPVEYHLKNERLKLQARQREFQALADNPNAAFDTLDASKDSKLSEYEHFLLDVVGLAPGGEAIDVLHAGIYAREGRHWEAGMTLAGAAPIGGIAPTVGKWGIQLGKAADGAALDAAGRLDGVTTESLDLLRHEGHGAVADVAERELRYLSKANVETSARIDKLLHDPAIELSSAARSELNDALGSLDQHMKSSDLIGMIRDNHSLPVLNPKKTDIAGQDVYYQHYKEIDEGLRSLTNAQESLQAKLTHLRKQPTSPANDASFSAISSTLEAVNDMQSRIDSLRKLK